MLTHAFARIEAARLAPVGYVTLVWGVLFGALLFAEVPGLATLAGAALIVLGTLLTRRGVMRTGRPASRYAAARGTPSPPAWALNISEGVYSASFLARQCRTSSFVRSNFAIWSFSFSFSRFHWTDLDIVRPGTRHLLSDLQLQLPVLLGKSREICGKRHRNPPNMV